MTLFSGPLLGACIVACGSATADVPGQASEGDSGAGDASLQVPTTEVDASREASVDSGNQPDAPDTTGWTVPSAAPDCDPAKDFEASSELLRPSPADPSGFRPTLSPDERTILFYGGIQPDVGVWSFTRPNRNAAFGSGTLVFKNPNMGQAISVDATGRTLVYELGDVLYEAKRSSIADPFSSPRSFLGVAGNADRYFTPSLSAGGDEIVASYSRAGTYSIVRAPVANGTAGTVEKIAIPNVTFPALSFDRKTLFFTSAGSLLFVTRATPTSPFNDVPQAIPMFVHTTNATPSYFPIWVSPDNCRLYYAQSFNGLQLRVASRGK